MINTEIIISKMMQIISHTNSRGELEQWEVSCKAALKLIEFRKEKIDSD
jgi:hypothetical protein